MLFANCKIKKAPTTGKSALFGEEKERAWRSPCGMQNRLGRFCVLPGTDRPGLPTYSSAEEALGHPRRQPHGSDSGGKFLLGKGGKFCRPREIFLALHVYHSFQHGVCSGDNLTVGLETALRGDHVYEFARKVYVGAFQILSSDGAKPVGTRRTG